MAASGPAQTAPDGLPVLEDAPGHLIRRTQQVHVGLWQQHLGGALTSIQFGVLLVVGRQPGIDQRTVAELMSLDRATAAGVLRRLEAREYMVRDRDPADGRRVLARLTDAGMASLIKAAPAVLDVQNQLLDSLSFDAGETLLRLLRMVAYRGEPPSTTAAIPENAPVAGWPLRLPPIRLHTAPGHLIRRAQQLHTTLWTERVSSELTSVQYSVLLVVHREAPVNQRVAGRHASLDKSTGGDVIARLESRKLIKRTRDAVDGRHNLLSLTVLGRRLLVGHAPAVLDVQRELIRALSPIERDQFAGLMKMVVAHPNRAATTDEVPA